MTPLFFEEKCEGLSVETLSCRNPARLCNTWSLLPTDLMGFRVRGSPYPHRGARLALDRTTVKSGVYSVFQAFREIWAKLIMPCPGSPESSIGKSLGFLPVFVSPHPGLWMLAQRISHGCWLFPINFTVPGSFLLSKNKMSSSSWLLFYVCICRPF